MGSKELLLGIFTVVFLTSATLLVFGDDIDAATNESPTLKAGDPLIQGEGHDHKDASQHEFGTDNMELLDFNPLTTPGNAEVQVATTPDGETYAYLAGWNDMHIVDVTDPTNTTVTGVYNDPNTQVLDVKYLEYNGREYIIQQNQLVDPGNSDPNIGQWSDPAQVSVTLIDVTDKTNPVWIDSWYDVDHPTGPHNLYTHMIDGEWYMFIANPDYDNCNDAIGEACGGVTIAHLNLVGSAANNIIGVPGVGLGQTIVKVGEYEVAWETTMGGWIYIHDMTVQTWPGEDPNDPRHGRTFIYGSYWEAGLRIGDVTDVPHLRTHPKHTPSTPLFVKLDKATPSCADGEHLKSVCGWISSTWTVTANRTAAQQETKTVVACLTFTMLNRSQPWWIYPMSAIPMNPFISSPQPWKPSARASGLASCTSSIPRNTPWKMASSNSNQN